MQKNLMPAKASSYFVRLVCRISKRLFISLIPAKIDYSLQWLLASASFYPAMQAQLIDGIYYIDGGYRNNLPIDVAIERGATEVIAVDVQGPGINKKVQVSESIAQIQLLHLGL